MVGRGQAAHRILRAYKTTADMVEVAFKNNADFLVNNPSCYAMIFARDPDETPLEETL